MMAMRLGTKGKITKAASDQQAELPPQSWRPDWRDIANYKHMLNYKPYQWGWEFLRRNSRYQRDYLRVFSAYIDHPDIVSDAKAAFSDTTSSASSDKAKHLAEKVEALALSYGLRFFPPAPWDAAPADLQNEYTAVEASRYYRLEGLTSTREKRSPISNFDLRLLPGEVAIKFSVFEPLPPQLRRAESFLKKEANRYELEEKRLVNTSTCMGYLRLLDAKAAGASNETIEAVLKLDGKRLIQKQVVAANRLVHEGYKLYLSHVEMPKNKKKLRGGV